MEDSSEGINIGTSGGNHKGKLAVASRRRGIYRLGENSVTKVFADLGNIKDGFNATMNWCVGEGACAERMEITVRKINVAD
jgi:hypothetical protein